MSTLVTLDLVRELEARVDRDLIKRIPHETLPLAIYNYTDRCVWEKGWDDITEQARGLVVDRDGAVVARPFRKFFNLGERPETMLENLPAEVPELSEKYDGSLIIAFNYGGEWICHTRGSWHSPQAEWAQVWLRSGFKGNPALTYLFELCAPWNRIVVPYSSEQMVLIGAIETATGRDYQHAALVDEALRIGAYPPARHLHATPETLDLTDETAEGEGYVARYSNGFRVKLKYATYLRLHKILTGLSIKGIWENLSSGAPLDLGEVPDEFMAWYDEQAGKLTADFDRIAGAALRAYAKWPKDARRKDIALELAKLDAPVRAALFRLLDGRACDDVIWKAVKPVGKGEVTFQKPEAA